MWCSTATSGNGRKNKARQTIAKEEKRSGNSQAPLSFRNECEVYLRDHLLTQQDRRSHNARKIPDEVETPEIAGDELFNN
jgi:hypothetical protein